MVDISTGRYKFGPGAFPNTVLCIFVSSIVHDVSDVCERLHIVHNRRTSVQTNDGREWGLDPGISALPFQRFDQGCLFPADVGSGSRVNNDVQVVTGP